MPDNRIFLLSASDEPDRATTLFALRIGARPITDLVRYALPLEVNYTRLT